MLCSTFFWRHLCIKQWESRSGDGGHGRAVKAQGLLDQVVRQSVRISFSRPHGVLYSSQSMTSYSKSEILYQRIYSHEEQSRISDLCHISSLDSSTPQTRSCILKNGCT